MGWVAFLAQSIAPGPQTHGRRGDRGDPPDGLFAVLDGAVRIAATTESGKKALLALLEAPTWFGEIAVFDGRPRAHDAVADENTLVAQVPQTALDAFVTRGLSMPEGTLGIGNSADTNRDGYPSAFVTPEIQMAMVPHRIGTTGVMNRHGTPTPRANRVV
jgi:CRP-like cAMP-binding protein